jgi:hypothetical protein
MRPGRPIFVSTGYRARSGPVFQRPAPPRSPDEVSTDRGTLGLVLSTGRGDESGGARVGFGQAR